MFAANSLSENIPAGGRQPRADGGVRVSFRRTDGADRLADCVERDGYKIRFPKTGVLEGVVVNTGGGVAGGDRVRHGIALGEATRVTLSTPSAERIYRSLDAPSQIEVSMRLEAGALLAWLPQETILFNRANLARRFDIDMAPDASLLMAEITVFGRKEMGETISAAKYSDRWHLRRAAGSPSPKTSASKAICTPACRKPRPVMVHASAPRCCSWRRRRKTGSKPCGKHSRVPPRGSRRAPGTGCCVSAASARTWRRSGTI